MKKAARQIQPFVLKEVWDMLQMYRFFREFYQHVLRPLFRLIF